MYLFYYVSIFLPTSKMDPFCGPIVAQILPKMHGLAYKISKFSGQGPCAGVGAGGRRPQHKSAPMYIVHTL